jgi:hypothetical protein
MPRKIFVTYKYGDTSVRPLQNAFGATYPTSVRNYVDLLQAHLDANDHINKGEQDGQNLSQFKDETIASSLRDKIFDSSVTVVLLSKNMKNPNQREEDQWIPWEISYSLRDKTREGRTSGCNAHLAIVIPDENNSYEYFVQHNPCPHYNSTNWKHEILFNILGKNMFNRKQPQLIRCTDGGCNRFMHTDTAHSYIHPAKWDDFIANINGHIDFATQINENINDYNIVKSL